VTVYCPRCRRTDGDWKRALRVLPVVGGNGARVDVWRHRPCGYMVACRSEPLEAPA